MASNRHDDSDGSDIFWPGYVDATTNLILNLLFLLTILIVAVFMFALELGRSTKLVQTQQPEAVVSEEAVPAQKVVTALLQDVGSDGMTGLSPELGTEKDLGLGEEESLVQEFDPVQENLALKREIERLNTLLAERVSDHDQGGGLVKTVDATINVPQPQTGLDKTLAQNAEVMVRFKDNAIAFTEAERETLLESLRPFVAAGHARIVVEVPSGFSEAKRLGYYRAMAVRNLLLEMQLTGQDVDVLVIDGKHNADASLVRVR